MKNRVFHKIYFVLACSFATLVPTQAFCSADMEWVSYDGACGKQFIVKKLELSPTGNVQNYKLLERIYSHKDILSQYNDIMLCDITINKDRNGLLESITIK
jgi:hypothetical protein